MSLHGHPVELGGERRSLKLEFNELADLNKACRQELGESWQDALRVEGSDTEIALDPYLLRLLIYHGLKHDHPGLSERQVGEWIQERIREEGREGAMSSLMVAFFRSLESSGYLPEEFDIDEIESGGPTEEGKETSET